MGDRAIAADFAIGVCEAGKSRAHILLVVEERLLVFRAVGTYRTPSAALLMGLAAHRPHHRKRRHGISINWFVQTDCRRYSNCGKTLGLMVFSKAPRVCPYPPIRGQVGYRHPTEWLRAPVQSRTAMKGAKVKRDDRTRAHCAASLRC